MPADGFNQNWIDTLCMESQHAWHLLRKIDKFNCFPPRLWKPTIMQIRGPSIFWRQEKIDVWEKCGRKPFQTTEKEEQRRKLTPSVMTASFKNWSMFTEKLALLKYSFFAQILKKPMDDSWVSIFSRYNQSDHLKRTRFWSGSQICNRIKNILENDKVSVMCKIGQLGNNYTYYITYLKLKALDSKSN